MTGRELPPAFERLVTDARGWTDLIRQFWDTVLTVAPGAHVTALRADRELRVLSTGSVGNDRSVTALLRDEADFVEEVAATLCPGFQRRVFVVAPGRRRASS